MGRSRGALTPAPSGDSISRSCSRTVENLRTLVANSRDVKAFVGASSDCRRLDLSVLRLRYHSNIMRACQLLKNAVAH